MVSLLMYDKRHATKKAESTSFLEYVVLIPLVTIMLWVAYFALGFVIADAAYRIIILAIGFAFLQTGASGSALARTFWVGLPSMFLAICTMQALGIWASVTWLGISILIEVPLVILSEFDD